MNLYQQILNDLKQAMRDKDPIVLNTLRMLKSALTYSSIEKEGANAPEPTDADVIAAVRKEIKKRQDAIQQYEQAKRQDLLQKEQQEKAALEKYLPQPLSTEEIEKLIAETAQELGASSISQMGSLMKALQQKVQGRVDNQTLSTLVKKHLS